MMLMPEGPRVYHHNVYTRFEKAPKIIQYDNGKLFAFGYYVFRENNNFSPHRKLMNMVQVADFCSIAKKGNLCFTLTRCFKLMVFI